MEQWAKLVEKAGGALIYAVLLKVRHLHCGLVHAPHPHPVYPAFWHVCSCTPFHSATPFTQAPEEGMLRATIQPLARLPAWSHVTFAEVDLKQLTVGRCTAVKDGSAMFSVGPWGHMPSCDAHRRGSKRP